MAEKVRVLDLQAFVTLAREKSFSKTGKKLGMTQSSITQLVQKLEEALGTKLVSRSSKSFTLTKTGRMFHEAAKDMLERFKACTRDIDSVELESRNKVHVVVSTTPGEFIFPRFFSEFSRMHPEIRLVIEMVDSKRALELLAGKEAQVAIVGGIGVDLDETYEKVILLQEPLDLIVSSRVEAPGGKLSIDTLAGMTRVDREAGSGTKQEAASFIETIDAKMRERGVQRASNVVSLQSVQAILTAVADSDDAYSVVGHYPAKRYSDLGLVKIVTVEGIDVAPSRFIMLVYNKHEISDLVRAFKNDIEHFCYIRSIV